METSNLSEIKRAELKEAIITRTGSTAPNAQGLCCPNCGAREVYASPLAPTDTSRWAWAIRAFKVDDWSECRSCTEWFRC